MKIAKTTATCQAVRILLIAAAMLALSSASDRGLAQAPVHEYWVDHSTGLMWTGKDNGQDLTWHKAVKYCRDLQLAGYSDWSLPTLAELEGIYDKSAHASGHAGPPRKPRAFTWHVKGDLFLTGNQWSSTQKIDDRGHPSGWAWRFDFNEGQPFDGDEVTFHANKRALCVRRSGE